MFSRRVTLLTVFMAIAAVGSITAATRDLALNNPPVRFAIIGDRTGQHVPGIYEEIVAEVEAMHPDFVMTVGDAIEGYTTDTLILKNQWDDYFSVIKPLTMPVYLTPGNHDITYDAALPVFREKVGDPYYSFNVRNYHFIVLDVSRWNSKEPLPKDEFDWLINDLKTHQKATQTLVFYHKPFWYDTVVMGRPDTLHSLFKAYGVDAVFNGHLHNYFSAKIDGILYTALGSSGGIIDAVPTDLDYHFTWVTLDDKEISVAPIKRNSVKSWDLVSASEAHIIDDVTRNNMNFSSGAIVSDNLKVTDGIAKLDLINNSDQAFNDTLHWKIPDGWTIKPSMEFVSIPPREKKEISFEINSTGNLYPVPVVTARFPYAPGKEFPVTRDLRIARTASAQMVSTSPEIDGALAEKCWSNSYITLFNPDGGDAAIDSTWIYFAYDRDNLYIAAHCLDSDMKALKSYIKDHDGAIYSEDCVGFFIQPNCQIDTAYQIYFNPSGISFDQKIRRGSLGYYDGDKSWNGSYDAKTLIGKQYWNLEVKIPLAQFGVVGKSGEAFGLNFLRKQSRLDTSANWQVPIDYDPRTFGILHLN